MKQIVDFKMHDFPMIKDKKSKVKLEKLDISKLQEIKLK